MAIWCARFPARDRRPTTPPSALSVFSAPRSARLNRSANSRSTRACRRGSVASRKNTARCSRVRVVITGAGRAIRRAGAVGEALLASRPPLLRTCAFNVRAAHQNPRRHSKPKHRALQFVSEDGGARQYTRSCCGIPRLPAARTPRSSTRRRIRMSSDTERNDRGPSRLQSPREDGRRLAAARRADGYCIRRMITCGLSHTDFSTVEGLRARISNHEAVEQPTANEFGPDSPQCGDCWKGFFAEAEVNLACLLKKNDSRSSRSTRSGEKPHVRRAF